MLSSGQFCGLKMVTSNHQADEQHLALNEVNWQLLNDEPWMNQH